MGSDKAPMISVAGITKSFGSVQVLNGVSFEARPGEVLAIVGENGAGKSTLIKIISGAYQDYGGEISLDGSEVEFPSPGAAISAGIQVIYQEFRNNLFPQRSVAENLFALDEGKQFGGLWVDKKRMNAAAKQALEDLGIDLDPTALVGSLAPAEQQMLAIAKASREGAKLLILDEPTAALDEQEVQQLFEQVRRMRDKGVCVIYITHRLNELFALCDRVLVLRNGRVEADSPVTDVTEDEIVSAMVGREISELFPSREVGIGDVVLSVDGLGGEDFSDVSFEVRSGEVLGIGGPLGCGKSSVLRTIFGLMPASGGDAMLGGNSVLGKKPDEMIQLGVSYLAPDRGSEGLCLQQAVSHNISLPSLRRLTQSGFVRRRQEKDEVVSLIDRLSIRTPGPGAEVGTLSGGNQQKAMFAKWIMAGPSVLLMEEPTRGVDVGSKADIYRIINSMVETGIAVVLVSSDLPELVEMSDRVLVMRDGSVKAELEGERLSQEAVLTHALRSA